MFTKLFKKYPKQNAGSQIYFLKLAYIFSLLLYQQVANADTFAIEGGSGLMEWVLSQRSGLLMRMAS
ncbi:hypothetical protein P3339_22165 [Microbulbifer sp. MLAF003]|uniref:hypothetical protein n=1 Tax=Microbulbifer sp. MLAF003 TaxID=3032582 RepID=UPI0024ACFFF0|nr:hypothetical protein [Microbulbifer sp. MLAF003]WHI51072.1 hypothetical protein P3339_22165 [Microbulbifer sp. MLAF003]